MTPSWTSRLAVALAASQSLISSISAQLTSSSEATPITSTSGTITAASASSTPTGSSEPKVHKIVVGNGGFKFEPDQISNASVGDIVTFEFYPPDHSVARAEFGKACVPYEYTGKDKVGFWSTTQYLNTGDDTTHWNLTINSTEPIFFYCAAPKSCTDQHMVGAINPNGTQTLDAQIRAARSADFQVAPGEPIPNEATSTLTNGPTSSATSASSSDGDSHKLSGGVIAGIVVGAVAFLVICAALFFYVGRSKSLKEVIKRQDATVKSTTPDPHMSQYGAGGLPSPGYPSHASTPGQAEYGFNSPPQYGQHHATDQYPSGWGSPQQQHLSMMSSTSGMSQQQLNELKYAQMNAQPAELHSPPLGQHAAELEAPGQSQMKR